MSGYLLGQKANKQEFVGLSNQGATCYMNSLLQTLYMTPNFRNEIYKWQYDREKHGDPEDCIPMQLQLLFTKLQIADSVFIETTGLTKSFQWDLRESFQQHDVQEFCRVLFDAIEQSMEGTNQSNVINELYQGTYSDYVKCLNCGYESCREDKFLDISLAVRSDFDKIYNKSVEMALENFIKHEELTGENKYYCEKCKNKFDAIKGLKFKNLPKILVLQLKRFDLDMTTMQRIKLNDKVTFPEILNMNPYISQNYEAKSKVSIKLEKLKAFQDYENTAIYQSQDKKPLVLENFFKKKLSGDNSYFLRCEKNKLIEKYSLEGKNVYELFSVMIHSGSALGGHYYAYIKNFENFKWLCFNDSIVTEITPEDIQKVYGGNTFTSGNFSNCSTNAYLLMYRKIDPENINKVDASQVPGYIIDQIEQDKHKLNEEILEREEKLKYLKIKVICKSQEKVIEIKKDALIKEFKHKAIEEFNLADLGVENIRLRGYSGFYETFQEVYNEDKTVDEVGIYSHKVIAVEIKASDEEFVAYDPAKISLKINIWQDGKTFEELTGNPKSISIEKRETLRKLMEKLEEVFGIPLDKQVLFRKSYTGSPEIVSTQAAIPQSLSYARIFEGNILYLEPFTTKIGKWQTALEEEHGKILLRYNNPKETEDFHNSEIFKHKISIDKQKNLLDLKQELGQLVNLSIDEFIMKKSSLYGPEMKDLSVSLLKYGFSNNNQVFLELGKPSKPDEVRISFQLSVSPKPKDSDGTIFAVDGLFELPININSKVFKLKELFCLELKSRFPSMTIDPNFIRFRHNSYTILGKILNNKEVLKELKFTDKVSICAQILESPERLIDSSEIIVYIKVWDPDTWELSAALEIVINKNAKIHDLGSKISAVTKIEV